VGGFGVVISNHPLRNAKMRKLVAKHAAETHFAFLLAAEGFAHDQQNTVKFIWKNLTGQLRRHAACGILVVADTNSTRLPLHTMWKIVRHMAASADTSFDATIPHERVIELSRDLELEFPRFDGHFSLDEGECAFYAENEEPVPDGIQGSDCCVGASRAQC
jgi:hypothetical protein